MLTPAQIANIHKFDSKTLLQIMHECAEALGLVSVDEYCDIMGTNKRTTYQHIKDGKLKYFEISNHKYLIINENI